MATPLQSSTRLKALDKGTHSPLTSFFSAQVSVAYSDTLRFLGKSKGFPYVRKALADPSFLCRRQLAFLQVHNYWMPQDSRPFKQLWKGFWPAAKQVKDLFFFFNKSTSSATIEQITSYLGAHKVKQYKKYLGLPTLVERNKKASLLFIKERVWTKLLGWKEQLLS